MVKVIIIVSASIVTVDVFAWVREIELPLCVRAHPDNVAGVAAHIDATVLVTVIVVGAIAVVVSGVYVTVTLAGKVPSFPTVASCVAKIASVPCCAAEVT